jgi:primosomal protein N' (replication factor Y)
MILLNRRGYSFTVICRSCGEKIECENCAIALTYHKPSAQADLHVHAGDRLECHYCGFRRPVPRSLPQVRSEHLYYLGAGSQQGEERLQELFPNARIGRMDRDTVRGRGDMERLLTRLHSGEINLLVGTQMIAKGHDVHGITLVGVVGADSALGLPDFRAAERVFQLLTQVSGRAGRGELPGRVLVQTYHPDHYAIQCACHARLHRLCGQGDAIPPPGCTIRHPAVLANLIVQGRGRMEEAAVDCQRFLAAGSSPRPLDKVRVLGPAAAPIARLKRIYRFHFVLKAERRDTFSAEPCALCSPTRRATSVPRRNLSPGCGRDPSDVSRPVLLCWGLAVVRPISSRGDESCHV